MKRNLSYTFFQIRYNLAVLLKITETSYHSLNHTFLIRIVLRSRAKRATCKLSTLSKRLANTDLDRETHILNPLFPR